MSPLGVRRYRAERALRDEFEGLRGRVLASVGARLRARGIALDHADLDACYAQAWQGLYAVLLDGGQVANPGGWLALVTYRRALDEHRARVRAHGGARPLGGPAEGGGEPVLADRGAEDVAGALDDRRRLLQLLEAMRGRLGAREREAASLCYLQGLSRREAARHMGISDARMRKLMDGARAGRPGVASQVSALVDTVRRGRWCEQQASLMRAFAYGVLEPGGERHRLAVAHVRGCPACRAYVVSLRGLAAALPPALGPLRLLPAGFAHAAAHSSAAAAPVAPPAVGSAPAFGGGASGAGLAGAGAKLAAGCALALGVGAGCVALTGAGSGARAHTQVGPAALVPATSAPSAPRARASFAALRRTRPAGSRPRRADAPSAQARQASREFSPEQGAAGAGVSTASAVASAAGKPGADREFGP